MPKFVARQRKHKARDHKKRQNGGAASISAGDSNLAEIVPAPKAEREERRQQLREELRAQLPKVSRKKQKRLDKYIDTKLKKDESLDLIKKLSRTKVDTSLLQSTKRLGQVTQSKKEIFSKALRERNAGINLEEANKILYEKRKEDSESEEESIADDEDTKPTQLLSAAAAASTAATVVAAAARSDRDAVSFGSGLKRPLDLDDDGNPMITKRKRTTPRVIPAILLRPQAVDPREDDEPEWEGFGSDSDAGLELENSEADEDSKESETSSDDDDDDDDDDDEEEEDKEDKEENNVSDDDSKAERKARASAFKAWAEQQRNEVLGFVPSTTITEDSSMSKPINFVPRPIEQDPLPPELEINSNHITRKAHAVHVERTEELQAARLALPVVAEEQKIMESIFSHDVVIISGTTGSGKTTQVPQFLYEAGFGDPSGPTPGLIGITQPRRVAAVSMAKRVGDELGDAKEKVSYQIRFDTTVSKQTAIKFMTDGVLLREMAQDFSLKKYSAIIVDEAHERTVNTDILISLMSRCVKARAQLAKERPKSYTPLKLIIMSATLRVSDFRENERLFKSPPPLVQAEGRQFDVVPHWSRRTSSSYLAEAFKKVSRGHRKLPPGGFLVFLTGQNEIRTLAQQLRQSFPTSGSTDDRNVQVRVSAAEMVLEGEDFHLPSSAGEGIHVIGMSEDEDESDSEPEIEGLDEPDSEFKIGEEEPGELLKVHVLPLYSQLPSKEQLKVFEPPPEGSRLIVLATNVAETSLTIPGIRYVFDSGRVKERKWDMAGVQTFETTWVSKASADQRMGRAGRTGPGHCYRLYSSAIYETFKSFAEPEIHRSPLEGVVLQLKALNVSRVDNFPFPTPPDRRNLVKSETLLTNLGALDSNGTITSLGRELHNYPLNPRFAQMLRLGQMYNCIDLTIAMVAALDVPEVFIPQASLDLRPVERVDGEIWTENDNQEEQRREERQRAYNSAHGMLSRLSGNSDAIKLLAALQAYGEAGDKEKFCAEMFLRSKALKEASQLREQLTGIINNLKPGAVGIFEPRLPKPSEKALDMLKQIVAAGFIDQIAIRADCLPTPPLLDKKPKRAIDVRYQTLMPSHEGPSRNEEDSFVYIHPSSLLARRAASKMPQYVVYHRLQRSQNAKEALKPKTRMHPLTPVSAEQLAVLARGTNLLEIGKPIGRITVLESVQGLERRQCDVVLSLVKSHGEIGWSLTKKTVVQRREPKEGWVVEKIL